MAESVVQIAAAWLFPGEGFHEWLSSSAIEFSAMFAIDGAAVESNVALELVAYR